MGIVAKLLNKLSLSCKMWSKTEAFYIGIGEKYITSDG